MREQLTKYIDLLFAGAEDADDIKQEILQNTLDRYDDLIAQGKTPESAYSLAISGIGDVSELLGGSKPVSAAPKSPEVQKEPKHARLFRTLAVILFILCPIPVILTESILGVCLLLAMVAAGVGLLIFFGKDDAQEERDTRSNLHKLLHGITWGAGLALYFWLSFATEAWYITWLIFPIIGFLCSLVNAIFDLNKRFLNALVRIIIFGILALVFAAILIGSCFAVNIYDGIIKDDISHSSYISESSGSVSAASVNNIQIEWVSGSITLKPGDVTDIQFSETGSFPDTQKMVWRQSGDTLVIQFSKPAVVGFGVHVTLSKDLTVTVPKEWICSELEIDSVSAEIKVEDIQMNEMELVNVSGHCQILGCSANSFSAETVSGKVRFEGTLQELDFDTVSASCTAILSENAKKIDMNAVSGDLILVLPENSGFTLDLESVSGDLISDFATTSSKDRHTSGDGSCRITAESVSGDVKIQKP